MADPKVGESDEFGGELEPQGNLSNESTQPIQDATNVKNLESELNILKKELKGLQGRQDKEKSAFQEFLAEYKSQKKRGLGDEEAEEAASSVLKEREEAENQKLLLKQIAQKLGLDPASSNIAGNNMKRATGYEKVIEKLQLDINDPIVTKLMRENTDITDFALEASKYVRQQNNAPQLTEAQKPASTASRQIPSDVNQLAKEYVQKVLANRGNKAVIEALKREYTEKGVPVGSVNFST